jgi:anti-sigma regulatory factor (Ser/Thr protein kinase)
MDIPARFDAVPAVAREIEQFMKGAGFSDPAVLDVQLAVEEIIANTIRHGFCGNPGSISIHSTAAPDGLTVEITDRAPPFNPLSVPSPDVTSSLAERKTGGLGIYLVRQVIDTVTYRYEDGKNILLLTKKKQKDTFS